MLINLQVKPMVTLIDPQVKPILDAMANVPSMASVPLNQARQQYDAMRSMGFGPSVKADSVEDISISGPVGKIQAKLYRSKNIERQGLLIQVHGGGYVAGSIAGYEKESHAFSVLSECTVLTFNYRLALLNEASPSKIVLLK